MPVLATMRRRTKRWEAHIWADKKQVYLGGFVNEARAGAAHDVMAIKCRGRRATRTCTNRCTRRTLLMTLTGCAYVQVPTLLVVRLLL